MGDVPAERRRKWTREIDLRLKEYEEQWTSRAEATREALHDERSRTVHGAVRERDVERHSNTSAIAAPDGRELRKQDDRRGR